MSPLASSPIRVLAAGLLLVVGCKTAFPAAPAPDAPAGAPERRPAADPRTDAPGPREPTGARAPAGDTATNGGGANPRERPREIGRLISELDSQDQNRVYFAAVSLLVDWTQTPADPTGLRAIAARLQGSRPEQQQTLVKAIGHYTTFPGASDEAKVRALDELVPLLEPFLGHTDERLRREAIDALAVLDSLLPEDPPNDPVDQLVRDILSPKPQRSPAPSPDLRRAAVRLVGRKPPKKAVPRLIEVIERFPRVPAVKAAAFEELYGVTGIDFRRDLAAAQSWWEKNRERRPEEWYRERFRKFEEEVARGRRAHRDTWALYVRSFSADDPRLYPALRDSLVGALGAENPLIRAEAAAQLAALGRPEAFDTLVEAVATEKEPEVTRAILAAIATAASTPPEESADAKLRAVRAVAPLAASIDNAVRIAAADAAAALGLEEGARPLVERLHAKDRDPDVVVAILKALARIGAKSNLRVLVEINTFLRAELERPADDPARDVRLLAEGALALSALAERKEIPPATEEALKASANLRDILRYKYDEPLSPEAVRGRQFAALALGKLGLRAALPVLQERLDDRIEPDESVARYAATAIGEIASTPDVPADERLAALAKLRDAFDVRRAASTREALFKAILAIVKSDPNVPLATLDELADKLAQAGDPARVAKLLEALPERPPAGGEPRWFALREKQARALEAAKEFAAAAEIWASLAARDPRYRMPLAGALVLAGKYDDGDRIYVDLLQKAPPAEVPAIWAGRQALLRRLLEANDAEQARARARAMLAGQGPLAPPPDAASAIQRVVEEAGGSGAGGAGERRPEAERRPGAPLPGSVPAGERRP